MDILIRMLMAVLKDRKHKKQRRVLSTVLAAVVVFMTTYSLILPAITLEESTAETTDGIFLESADVSEADPADDDVDPSGELLLTDDAREESAPASDGWEDGLIEDADWEENGELADIPDEPALTDTGDETEEAAETETGNVYAETEEATEDTTESEESVGEGETESELEEQYPEVELSDSTQYTQVKVYAPEGAFPEGTQMLLSDVEDDETIAAICDAALAENSLVQKVHAVDISFRNSRNEEIEPLLPIRVEMTAEKCAEVGSSSVSSSVVHVDDSGNATIVENAQKVEAEAEDEKDADKLEDVETIAFEAKEFSVYALVYTVDFEYSVNGKMYQFSLPGGEKIALSDLIEVLGIIGDTNNGEKAAFNSVDSFLKEVANVEFSDESLVKVTPVEGDWELESLQPFDTDESLTITMKNGDVVTVKVTDAQLITDLSQILDSTNGVTVIGANKVGNAYQVKENQPYEIQLHFLETNDKQIDFTQDGSGNYPTMTYQLPAGLRMESHNGAIEGDGFTLAYTIDANGLMTVNWVVNDADKFRRTVESNELDIKLNIKASFKTSDDKFEFAGGATLDVDVDGTRDLDITKTGRYDTNDKKMHYSVTVTSTGVNDGVVVTDKLSDTTGAVIYAKDVHATNGQTYPTTNNNDGFVVNVGRMLDGESIKFEYTADVNLEKLDVDANGKGGSVEQTGNTVKVKSTQVPEEKQKDWSLDHQIQVSSTNKGNATAGEIVDGKRTMNWHIDVNREQNISVKGKTIKDKITGGVDKMFYSGDGIYVTKHWKDSNGIQHSSGPELVSWDSLSQYSNTGANKGWTFTPNDDGNYWYEIDYTTVVNVDDSLTDISVSNHVDGPYGSNDGSGTAKQEDSKRLDFDKSVDSFDFDEGTVTWKVTISVPPLGLDKAVVEDNYPSQSVQGISVRRGQDVLLEGSNIVVSGTGNNEKYTIENIMRNPYYNGGEDVKAGFKVTFTKYDANSGTWVPGLTGTGEKHDVTVTVTTKMDEGWLEAAAESLNVNDFKHTNNATLTYDGDATLSDSASVTVNPEQTTMVKSVKDNKRLPTSDTNLILNDGTKVPCWVYYIDLKGISDATFMDNDGNNTDIVITDTYEEDYLDLLDNSLIGSTLTCYDGNIYTYNGKLWPDTNGNNGYDYNQAIQAVDASQTSRGKIVFRISKDDIPKNEHGEYYRHYRLSYTLYTPTAADLEALKTAAAHDEGGAHVMPNTARWEKTPDSSAEVEYKVQTVDKKASNAHFNTTTATYDIDYTITVNPNGEKIGDDDYIRVTDTYENLTINYATITWDPEDAIVNYDRNGDQLIFRVKNETPVTIRYTASARTDGHYENTVDVHGQTVTTKGEADISSHGSVSSTDYKITILKHEKGNMTKTLQGAKFSLYRTGDKAEGEGVLVEEGLTTNADGKIVIDRIHKTWVDQNDPDYNKMVDLESNVYYYVKETEAPTGPYGQYQLKTSQYFFKIVKGEAPNYSAEGGWKYLNNDVLAINNSYPEEESITVKVEKAWVGADDANLPDSINVTLYRKVDEYSSAKELVGNYQVKKADGWKLTIPDLPTGYAYVVEEQPMDGYEVEYTDNNTFGVTRSDTIGITNTRKKLEIVKTWQDGEGSLQGIDVIVKKDGQEYQRVTLLKSDGWKTSLYGLPEGEYTVEEIVPAGKELVGITYTDADDKTVDSLPGVGTATITNKDKTPEPNTTSLSVQKKWMQADGEHELSAEDLSYEKAKDLTATVELVRYRQRNSMTTVHFWTVNGVDWRDSGVTLPVPQAQGVKIQFESDAYAQGGVLYSIDNNKRADQLSFITTFASNSPVTVTMDTTGKTDVYVVARYGHPKLSNPLMISEGTEGTTSEDEEAGIDSTFTPIQRTLQWNNSWQTTFSDLLTGGIVEDAAYSYTYGIREVSCSDGFEFVSYGTLAVNQNDTNENKASMPAENGGTVQVVNKKAEQNGSLQLTKQVTVNNQPTATTLADGTYTFTIHSVADGETTTNDKTVTITVTDGKAVSATGGTFDLETKYVTVSDLAEGDYTITEAEVSSMTTTVSGGKENKNNETANTITVTVIAGENIAATAQATFTNDKAMTSFNFNKIWLGPTGKVATPPSYQDWKENITVTIKRKAGASGAEDSNFALMYTITNGSGSFSPITEENQSKLPTDEGTLNALTLTGSGTDNVFNFKLPEESLRKYNDDGTEWVYYVVEEKLDDYAPPAYGTSTTVESTTTYSITNGAQDAKDGGVIVNQTFGGYELPSTGGPGTLPYTLGGIALIMASALMYRFRMRRRERRLN